MKSKKLFIGLVMLFMMLVLSACAKSAMTDELALEEGKSSGKIYLYGEVHGKKKILDKELEEWEKHYNEEGMRHLFVELAYYDAEFLNIWMQADSDEILDALYDEGEGTLSHTPEVKEFYKQIKVQCPETIFHGTDVGHQRETTGKRYLEYLEDKGLEDSEQYALAKECVAQGEYYYTHSDEVYRENQMVLNFVREFDQLNTENIMGIYGAAHTGLDAKSFAGDIPCMAAQLKKRYGEIIKSQDLSSLAKETEPIRVDQIEVNGKTYKASYFGKENLSGFKDYAYSEYWRLEDAYDDFKNHKTNFNHLPCKEYPMLIEEGQILVIDYTKTDGSVKREYYRADGEMWEKKPVTVEIMVK